MNFVDFVNAKMRLNDLDPFYTAIHRAKTPVRTRLRLTFAQASFDHAGISCEVAESDDFWEAMRTAIRGKTRGGSRRYFRGPAAFAAVDHFEKTFTTVENLMSHVCSCKTLAEVEKFADKRLPQFGKWASFKLADMTERVCGSFISFEHADIMSSKQVQKGAEKAAASLEIDVGELMGLLDDQTWATLASPRFDRPLNVQEYETLLCNYSHEGDREHIPGHDVENIRRELEGYGKLAARLIKHLPERNAE